MKETTPAKVQDPMTTLDVRPILAGGGEPLPEIMARFRGLQEGEGFRLLAPFKPMPLLRVAESFGLAHWMKLEDGICQVLFWHKASPPVWADGLMPDKGNGSRPEVVGSNGNVPAPPCISKVLDARDMEPPEPLIKALEMLDSLPPNGVLLFIHHRFPRLLLEELRDKPVTWIIEHQGDDVVIRFHKDAEK